jgi:microcystin-dependent protein
MEGTIGEIRMFAGTFEPKSWAFCAGQILSVPQNTALFSILGTTYGGDGRNTFMLPNLCGRTAVGAGQGAETAYYPLGEKIGSETVTLNASNLPPHAHQQMASGDTPTVNTAAGTALASNTRATNPPMPKIYAAPGNPVQMGTITGPTGGSQPLNVVQPSLGINYIICTYGSYPSRN